MGTPGMSPTQTSVQSTLTCGERRRVSGGSRMGVCGGRFKAVGTPPSGRGIAGRARPDLQSKGEEV